MGGEVSAVETRLTTGALEIVRREVLAIVSKLPVPIVEIILQYYKPEGPILGQFVKQFAAQKKDSKPLKHLCFPTSTSSMTSQYSKTFESKPYYIAIQGQYIAVTENYQVNIFNMKKNNIITIGNGERSHQKGQFDLARGVTIKENKIYICDFNNTRISIFQLCDGQFLSDFPIEIGNPYGITIGETNLYITTWYPFQLCCYSMSGILIKSIILESYPLGLCVINNNIFVCKGYPQERIEIIDEKTLTSLKTFGENKFTSPHNILVYNNLLYISDSFQNCIQIWTIDGEYVNHWGTKGKTNGKLDVPYGLACNESELFVVDSNNLRIQIFE